MSNEVKGIQSAAIAALPPLAEKPVYMEILERVQQVWNAFYDCIAGCATRLWNWCASWIVTAPAEQPKAIEKKEEVDAEPATQEELVEWYRNTLLVDYQGRVMNYRVGDLNSFIERHYQIFLVACPHYTNARRNYTHRLLRLGADANIVAFNDKSMTPLRCAVLTGSLLAYTTLRQAGADPHKLYGGPLDKGESTVELLHRMHASPLSVRDFFLQEVPKNGTGATLFPGGMGEYYGNYGEDQFGTKEDIAKMIDYEMALITTPAREALGDLLPPAILNIFAEYIVGEKARKPA